MLPKPITPWATLLLAVVGACVALLHLSNAASAGAGSTPVYVYPIPGARVALPASQITIRGIPTSQFGSILVTGSQSGVHTGKVEPDSDGDGGSFLPYKPFTAGEKVTVTTGLNVIGASNGSWTFNVATQVGGIYPSHWPPVIRKSNDVMSYQSRPDLKPERVQIVTNDHGQTAPGDIFLAPQYGPLQDGPMILDQNGNMVWFKNLGGDTSATDVRVQSYQGKPVLTWWQGYVTGGEGSGEGVIDNTSYQQIGTVHAGNGVTADLHEFEVTSQNTALVTGSVPVRWNLSSVHGSKTGVVDDSVVQEIDIPTGLVLFQWDSLDHVPVTDSYQNLPQKSFIPYDYFHVNSIDVDKDNNLVVSARNTWAAYKINSRSGAVIWTLGGKHSTFKMQSGAAFAFQHDVRVRSINDWFVTLFDDGAGPPNVHKQSRAIKLFLNIKKKTATKVQEFDHSPSLLAGYEGNYQQLPNGDVFTGWGQQPYFTEFNSKGKTVFDGHFVDGDASYRAWKFPWTGTPQTLPAIAATNSGTKMTVYASWNGATNVASWRVLAGSSTSALSAVTTVTKNTFETPTTVTKAAYVAVQALSSKGQVLSTSKTIAG
jgi:hypothetical protein